MSGCGYGNDLNQIGPKVTSPQPRMGRAMGRADDRQRDGRNEANLGFSVGKSRLLEGQSKSVHAHAESGMWPPTGGFNPMSQLPTALAGVWH